MKGILGCMVCLAAAMPAFATDTIATFADPSGSSSNPLFFYNAGGNALSGAWSGTGLTLETISGDFTDVTFSMSSASVAGTGAVGAGSIEFFDSSNNSIFKIDFDSGMLNLVGFGATEFLSTNNVVFSGSILPSPVEAESFAFSFANQAPLPQSQGFSTTAAFTSSATLVPEPASLVMLGAGAVALLRRRSR